MKYISIIIFYILFSNYLFADSWDFSNAEPEQIVVESVNYKVIHFYNFNWNDQYAYIECINKNTDEVIFRLSSSYLTHLFISDDEEYIVGITFWYLDNPYQLIILDINGNIIKKRLISFFEYKLNQDELLDFSNNFPEQYRLLESMEKISYIEPYYYIDYFFPYRDGDLFEYRIRDFLKKYQIRNRLSNNFFGTATLYLFWFNQNNINLHFIYENNILSGVSLLDQNNERIIINIIEK